MDTIVCRLLYLASLGMNLCWSAPLQSRSKLWTVLHTNSLRDRTVSSTETKVKSEPYISSGHLLVSDSQHSYAQPGVQASLEQTGLSPKQAEVKGSKLSQTEQGLQDIHKLYDAVNLHNKQLRERSVHKTPEKTKRVAVERASSSGRQETEFARSEARLSHEIHETPKEYKASEMVLSIAGTLAILFSMGMLFAIFHCCCRKKRQGEDSEDEIVGKSTEKKVSNKKKSEFAEKNSEESTVNRNIQKSDSEPEEADDNDNKPVSVKSKIKAFEVKKEEPSPEMRPSPSHGRKRPESDAFKAFESKGILIGMGRSPRKVMPENLEEEKVEEEEEEEEEEEPHGRSSPEGARKVMLDGPSWLSPSIKVTEAEGSGDEDLNGHVSENPDVVIDTADDDREFDMIQRESEVLRSYRKAAPPRNRQKPTRGSKKRNARPSTESTESAENGPEITKKEEDEVDSKVKTVIADVVPHSDITHANTTDSPKTVPKEIHLDNDESSTQGNTECDKRAADNIFYQIDPTVKYKSTSDITGPGRVRHQRQSEGGKPHGPELSLALGQDQDLVNALKRKLKDHNECEDTKRSSAGNDDELEPLIRERTHSAPTNPKHETHL